MSDPQLLGKHVAWVFAGGAAAIAIAVTLALDPIKTGSWRTIFSVISLSVLLLGGASTRLTAVSTGGAIGRFAAMGAVVGAVYLACAYLVMGVSVFLLIALGGLAGARIGSSLREARP